MARIRGLEPGCLLAGPSETRSYDCKLAFSVAAHVAADVTVHMLAVDIAFGRCQHVSDWIHPDDPNGLTAEVTCWP